MTTLITGATGGIGRELALRCARHDADLIITGRDAGRLAVLKATLEHDLGARVVAVTIDLAHPDAAQRLHRFAHGRGIVVDTLVNDAGFGDWGAFLDMDEERMRAMMQVNMVTLAELMRLFGADMQARGHGRILNIASVAAVAPGPYMAMYYATKAFVRSLGEAVAYELRGSGVMVTTVCPGPVSTGFEHAAHMHGKNFYTLPLFKPSTPEATAAFAYARMQAGSALAYQGALAKMASFGVRLAPRALAARVAAKLNGGDPGARADDGEGR
ncbi:short-chain dehydrogenase [Bifidobacterium italicum]|uniref:Short-chain dehydrogenase n=1 Tax=Bifidobacterium italicum TaxID=1960968 RepID=A0A2A2EJF9_9BIFI|nr:SDR family oxidoreductase [Bifidobacterium italicum]PAU69171.1 short-chain dehydrogenase [Bifidobacterium italicum]